MIKKIISIIMISGIFLIAGSSYTAGAARIDIYESCKGGSGSTICKHKGDDINNPVKNIINMLLMIVAIAAVVTIIIAGIKYITSNGDMSKVTAAKHTLLYALIGLVVAAASHVIVKFVFDRIIQGSK